MFPGGRSFWGWLEWLEWGFGFFFFFLDGVMILMDVRCVVIYR